MPAARRKQDTNGGLGGGFVGFFQNLGNDLKEAAYGFFPGLGQMVVDPTDALKGLAKYYAEDSPWVSIFEGNFGEAAKRFYDHPLAPILDVAAIFTGGGTAVGKLTKSTAVEWDRALTVQGRIAPKDIVKGVTFDIKSPNLSTRQMQKFRGLISDNLQELFPSLETRVGKVARYEKGLRKEKVGRERAVGFAARSYAHLMFKAAKKIGDPGDYIRTINFLGKEAFGKMHDQLRLHAVKLEPIYRDVPPIKTTQKMLTTPEHFPRKPFREEVPPILPKGFTFIRDPKFIKKKEFTTFAEYLDELDNFAKDYTTRKHQIAAKDKDGNYLLAFKHDSPRWGKEAKESSQLMKLLWEKPHLIWKWTVLFRPAYVLNNTLGSGLMAAFTSNPVEFIGGVISAIRETKGLDHAENFVNYGYNQLNKGYKRDYYLDVYEGAFGDIMDQLNLATAEIEAGGKMTRGIRKTSQSMFTASHKIEQAIRGLVIDEFVIRQPEIKALMKDGLSFEQAAREASNNPAFRTRVKNNLEDRLGQYYKYEPWERTIKNYHPWYAWERAIVRHVARLSGPRKLAIAQTGMQGAQAVEEAFGEEELPPGFMQGLLPLGELGESALGVPGMQGRLPVLATGAPNPYAAIAEVATPLLGERPEDILAGTSPFLTAPISVATGKQIVTGEPIQRRTPLPGIPGFVGDVLANIVETLPQTKLVGAAAGLAPVDVYETRAGKQPFLFSRQWQELLAAYLGIPVKQVSPKAIKRKISYAKSMGYL